MSWEVIEPGAAVVTYSEAKAHLRLDSDDERAIVIGLVAAATSYGESFTQRSFTPRTLAVTEYTHGRNHHSGWIGLPRGPVTEIVDVTDDNGNTIDPARYEIVRAGTCDYLRFTSGGGTAPHVVEYVTGFDPTPADIRLAVLLHTAHLFANREAITERQQVHVALGLEAIYSQYVSGPHVC